LTPFKNVLEGNSFRLWVNLKHNDYAKEIKLDTTGAYNNAYIGKAWAKHGKEYLTRSPQLVVKVLMGAGAQFDNGTPKALKASFTGGTIRFFDNGRYWISNEAGTNIQKGNYYSGGRVLSPTDGINKGKQFKNGSVWTNAQNAIKA
jgi:hypothetical protein